MDAAKAMDAATILIIAAWRWCVRCMVRTSHTKTPAGWRCDCCGKTE